MNRLYFFLLINFLSVYAFAAHKIVYLTDVEGSWEKMERFFSRSEAFEKDAKGLYHVKHGYELVYGGDATDRDLGNTRIVTTLVRLKKESPHQVTLLMGNRELWKFSSASGFIKGTEIGRAMRGQMDMRRAELAAERKVDPSTIDSKEAIASLKQDYSPGGIYHEYLSHGELIKKIGNTLFVHGSVSEDGYKFVPEAKSQPSTVDDWTSQLNQWYKTEFASWEKGNKFRTNQWDKEKSEAASVVDARNVGNFNNPYLPPQHVIEALIKDGVNRIVVGHTPMDQMPVILRWKDKFEIVYADNSFAGNEKDAHVIEISGRDQEHLKVQVRPSGIDGLPALFNYSTTLNQKTPIGRRLANGSYVLAPVGSQYLTFRLGEGFSPIYDAVSAPELGNLSDPFEPPLTPQEVFHQEILKRTKSFQADPTATHAIAAGKTGFLSLDKLLRGQDRYSVLNIEDKMKEKESRGDLRKLPDGRYQLAFDGGRSSVPDVDPIEVIHGPQGYLIADGHHDFYLSHYLGAKTIAVKVLEDHSAQDPEKFWEEMAARGFTRLKAEPESLAKDAPDVLAISDYPNRYFAAIVAQKTGKPPPKKPLWVKDGNSVPFIEFEIADVLLKAGIEYETAWGKDIPERVIEKARKALLAAKASGKHPLLENIKIIDRPVLPAQPPPSPKGSDTCDGLRKVGS